MKAAVQSKYGSPDAITIEDLPTPVPAGNQVLIRVRAATVGIVDTLARKGEPAYARVAFGLRRRSAHSGCGRQAVLYGVVGRCRLE